MHFLGVGLPCRPLSDPKAELAVVVLDTRGAVLELQWRTDLDEVAALLRVLATDDTLIAAGAPLCELSTDGRSRAAVQALRHRLALTDVGSGVLECDAATFPFDTEDFEDATWPPKLCGHGRRTSRRTVELARAADDLVRRLGLLVSAHPPVDLHSSAETAALLTAPTPTTAADLEHRTVLLNALLCAWAASCWHSSPEHRATPDDGVRLAG
jgi:predicted RNase H-like nuclease